MKRKTKFAIKPKEVNFLRAPGAYNYEKHKEKYREKHRKQHFWLRVAIIVAIIVGAIIFARSSFFDVDQITVKGNKYFESDQIITMANAETGGNIFWGSNKSEIKKRLSKNPYISKVDVSMKLPRQLVITVEERIQRAYIKQGKEYVVIDGEGIVLNTTKTKPKLTEVVNIKIKTAQEGEALETVERKNFEKVLNIIDLMNENNIHFSKIKITQGTVYAYVYKDLICIGKYKDLVDNIESGNVGKVLVKLNQDHITRGKISVGNSEYISFSPV